MNLMIQILIECSDTELNSRRIEWISDGVRIVESGSHKHLLETDGDYSESRNAQMQTPRDRKIDAEYAQ